MLATIGLNRRNIKNWAVLDSGATGNFLVTNAPLTEKQETTCLLTLTLRRLRRHLFFRRWRDFSATAYKERPTLNGCGDGHTHS